MRPRYPGRSWRYADIYTRSVSVHWPFGTMCLSLAWPKEYGMMYVCRYAFKHPSFLSSVFSSRFPSPRSKLRRHTHGVLLRALDFHPHLFRPTSAAAREGLQDRPTCGARPQKEVADPKPMFTSSRSAVFSLGEIRRSEMSTCRWIDS